jgi:hypothetical protein
MPRLPPAVWAGVKRKRGNRGLPVAKGSRESQPRSGPVDLTTRSPTDHNSPSTTDDDENSDVACGGAENLEGERASELGAMMRQR